MNKKEFLSLCGYNKFIMALIGLDENSSDIVGNIIPQDGPILSSNFILNKDILNGYSGSLWGLKNSNHPKNSVIWIAVRVEASVENVILLDGHTQSIKFHQGFVCKSGKYTEVTNFIDGYKDNPFCKVP